MLAAVAVAAVVGMGALSSRPPEPGAPEADGVVATTAPPAALTAVPAVPALSALAATGAGGFEDAGGLLPEALADAPVERTEREVSGSVQDAARDLLEGYAARGGSVLVRAGWLDLLGRTWGCVVSGAGWVDVCLVTERGEEVSEVLVLRMEGEEWERAYGSG